MRTRLVLLSETGFPEKENETGFPETGDGRDSVKRDCFLRNGMRTRLTLLNEISFPETGNENETRTLVLYVL